MNRTMMRACRAIGLAFAAALTLASAALAQEAVVTSPVNLAGRYDPADTLVLYGDLSFFAGKDNPLSCILKSRYKRGEAVGFRMTAIDPASGQFAESAELVVKLSYGGKTEEIAMRYRGAGENARPGFWTAKWVVPDDAPVGVVKYTVEARDEAGRTGVWAPFNIQTSLPAVVE